MDRPIESNYTLKYPIPNGTQPPVTDVVVLRPKGKDRRVIDRHVTPDGGIINPVAMHLEMIERLVRLPGGGDIYAGFAEELDDEDVDALGKLVMPDLPSGRPTGGTPSGS
jgi:hypothetical protein